MSACRIHLSYYSNPIGFYVKTMSAHAISFEHFTFAVELYCSNPNAIKLFDFKKVTGKDKGGRKVQYTFQIFDEPSLSYTINAYITKCSLLINGKNFNKFLERDIEQIHEIMCNTTVNGAKINTAHLNSGLSKTLEEAIKSLKTQSLKGESSSNKLTKINKDEKCQKCNRNCKTRAVLCQKGHWIHYACDKLSETEIESIEKNDQPHLCKNCNSDIKDINRFSGNIQGIEYQSADKRQQHDTTIAESLLIEENLDTCLACTKILKDPTNSCLKCNLTFHENCMNNISNTCHSCIGLDAQRYIAEDLDIQPNNNLNDTLISHKTSSVTTNDQTYVKSHNIHVDLTAQTERFISVNANNTNTQNDEKTAPQQSSSKSEKQTLNTIPSNNVQTNILIQQHQDEKSHDTSKSNTSSKQSTHSTSSAWR